MSDTPRSVRKCPGCHYRIKAAEGWCRGCDGRLPADLATAVAEARAELDRALDDAGRWLHAHPRISARELQVVALAAQGLTDADIAARLSATTDHVKDQLRQVASRWGCRGRAQIVATAYRLRYLTVEEGPECLIVQE